MMLRLMLILSICFLNSIICNFKINELYPLKKGDALMHRLFGIAPKRFI